MRCEICNGGCADDSNPRVRMLTRINEKGVDGLWRCPAHIGAFVRVESNEQIEMDPDNESKASFIHSPDCGGYCDYACNSAGFDQAEHVEKVKGSKDE